MYMLAPLSEHYDDGFGAVGDAFCNAAKALNKRNAAGDGSASLDELPEIYLLRHAVELFLKSGIIIVHRRLRLRYGSEPHTTDTALMKTSSGKWKPLLKTHDIPELYGYWKELIVGNKDNLIKLMSHAAEVDVPAELDSWIKSLGKADPSSDYFRYPVSKNTVADKAKSPFKEVAPDSLFPAERTEYVKALVVENAKGEVVKAFKYDRTTSKAVAEAARGAAEMLSNFHFMMRVELTGGW
jgi:hypothetical protein